MKVTIIGTGDLDIIHKYARTSKTKLQQLLNEIAEYLVKKNAEIIILPARGIPYEFAQIYKKLGGKKVYGVIPIKCPYYSKYTKQITDNYMDVNKFELSNIHDGKFVVYLLAHYHENYPSNKTHYYNYLYYFDEQGDYTGEVIMFPLNFGC